VLVHRPVAEPDFGRGHTAIDGVTAATATGQARPGLQDATVR
jgi:hypothetical protein